MKGKEKAKQILHILVKNGAKMNNLNDDLWAPLHLAVKKNLFDAASDIIQLQSNPEYLAEQTVDINK